MTVEPSLMLTVIAVAGVASCALYLWRRQWLNAALVLVAASALAVFAWQPRAGAEAGRVLAIDPAAPPTALVGVDRLRLQGDGLRAGQWNDLPARPLEWSAPKGGALRLYFPQQLALGRMFELRLERDDKDPVRLELLAENGQRLAEARGTDRLSLEWLPPLAEPMLLKARLLDANDKVISEGPLPFIVQAPVPLQVMGRFGAPSFDLKVLNELLTNSGALVDWQVTLSRAITRSESAREAMAAPNLLLVDAARIERMAAGERAALLQQVAGGMSLLVLGANASDPGAWSRLLELPLRAQAEGAKVEQPFELPLTALAPTARQLGPWQSQQGTLWTRDWHKGRIGWLAVTEWHRYAISQPRALALWWQLLLDQLRITQVEQSEWLAQDEMPLPGQRLAVCARGVADKVTLPDLTQTLAWRAGGDHIDAACVALWPTEPGWLHLMDAKAGAHAVYVYAATDWPQWQAAQRRDATARYAARTPVPVVASEAPKLPGWPAALVFALAMLLLWWRERK